MSEDIQIVTIPAADPVAVTLPDVDVLVTEQSEPVVVESPDVEVVTLGEDVNVVETEREFNVVTLGEVGPQGPQGEPGTASAEIYVAATTLSGHRVIATNGAGLAIYADNTNVDHAIQAARISLGAADMGENISVQVSGRITEPSWSWIAGGSIYVGANGVLTQSIPEAPAVFSKVIAVAETATRILILNESPVLLA